MENPGRVTRRGSLEEAAAYPLPAQPQRKAGPKKETCGSGNRGLTAKRGGEKAGALHAARWLQRCPRGM